MEIGGAEVGLGKSDGELGNIMRRGGVKGGPIDCQWEGTKDIGSKSEARKVQIRTLKKVHYIKISIKMPICAENMYEYTLYTPRAQQNSAYRRQIRPAQYIT